MNSNIVSLSLPPEGVFNTFEALDSFTKEYTKSAGYTVVVGKSEKRNGRVLKFINCKRNGIEKDLLGENRQRRRENSMPCLNEGQRTT